MTLANFRSGIWGWLFSVFQVPQMWFWYLLSFHFIVAIFNCSLHQYVSLQSQFLIYQVPPTCLTSFGTSIVWVRIKINDNRFSVKVWNPCLILAKVDRQIANSEQHSKDHDAESILRVKIVQTESQLIWMNFRQIAFCFF